VLKDRYYSESKIVMIITHRKFAVLIVLFFVAIINGYVEHFHNFLDYQALLIDSHAVKLLVMMYACGVLGVSIVAYPQAFNRQYSPRFSAMKEKMMTRGLWLAIGYGLLIIFFGAIEVMNS